MSAHFSAEDVAHLLREPGAPVLMPTDDQRRVIEHPLGSSVLVVAGAGSGKTETIANRVVWLVLNGHVEPGAILGLTFTKKAAGELAERLRGKLLSLAERTYGEEWNRLSPQQRQRLAELGAALSATLDLPEASTYNAFAYAIAQEFGVSSMTGGTLIDDATAWGIARDLVTRATDSEISRLDVSVDVLTDHVLRLDRTASEHLVSLDLVVREAEQFLRVEHLPRDDKARDAGVTGVPYADVLNALPGIRVTRTAAHLAKAYQTYKAERGLLEYSDQVALALQALEQNPEAIVTLRDRHRVIFLDEMQDTSVAQTKLLSTVFRNMSVMAVGDPHQSIYGWRGASSESLSGFHRAFSTPRDDIPAVLTLSRSWRNATRILAAANVIAGPLRAHSKVHVQPLEPRPAAAEGTLDAHYAETIDEESRTVAEWIAQERERFRSSEGSFPTTAVLFRSRKHMHRFARALSAVGVPNHIVGVGGLLSAPEIVDIIATLRCLADPNATNHLIRLLAGPKFALGIGDIRGLQSLARWLANRDEAHRPIQHESLATRGPLDDAEVSLTLLDALDVLVRLPDSHVALKRISPLGKQRLRDAGVMLQRLRKFLGMPVPDLIGAAVRELGLDIELMSHERWSAETSAHAQSNILVFTEEVRNFLSVSDTQDLGTVLNWLERTERQDELVAYVPEPQPDTVQLTTVHSAKGLEWDVVAIPVMSEGSFPSSPQSTNGWLRAGTLPDRLRGDAATRPELRWELADTSKELKDRIASYRAEHRSLHEEEERRLVYVALTRARSALLLSGSFWHGGKRPRKPAQPLLELAEVGLIDRPPEASSYAEAPTHAADEQWLWPADALGLRRGRVEAAADAIKRAEQALSGETQLTEISRLLLAGERKAPDIRAQLLESWNRVNASMFHEVIRDADAHMLDLARPIPRRPFEKTRIGNLFHDWVEHRTTTPRGTEVMLDLDIPGEQDPGMSAEDEQQLQTLIDVFEQSPWAQLQPLLVEEELSVRFAGRRLVCKLDAVYERNGRIEIVDWKTGRPPQNQQERDERFLQLDLYRIAYAETFGVSLDMIDATLFYLRHDVTLTSRHIVSRQELESRWEAALQEG